MKTAFVQTTVVFSALFLSLFSYCLKAKTIPAVPLKPPNILWIYVEDMNDWMGAYGDNTVATPNIDALAKQGVRFTNAIMPAPVCSSTRSGIITGVMPTALGLHNHRSSRDKNAQIYLPKGFKTIPEVFQQHGYQTFNMGKDDYNFHYQRQQLFSIDPLTERLKKYRANPKANVKKGEIFPLSELVNQQPFFGQIQLEGGKDKAKALQPVALTEMVDKLPPYYPSHPSFLKAWARHYEQIAITDQRVGKIIAELAASNLLNNTAIFFFTDHGMVLPRHKQFVYEGGLRVPFVISWPQANAQLRTKGAVRDDIVNGIDIGTTSLGLAGIPIPSVMAGDNVFAHNYQEKSHTIATRDRLDYTFDRIRAVRTKDFKYIRNYFPERAYMQAQYRDLHPKKFPFMQAYKTLYSAGKLNSAQALFMAKRKPNEELYDLKTDPDEINNLASQPSYEKILKQHRLLLDNWQKAGNDQGQYPESDAGVAAVIKRWEQHCISPECQNYRKKQLMN